MPKRNVNPTLSDVMRVLEKEYKSEEGLHEVVRMCMISMSKNIGKINCRLEKIEKKLLIEGC